MEFVVGATLALFVCGAAWMLGMDRDRVFYPNVVMVTASYYVLFAVIDGGNKVLLSELAIAAVFTGVAVVGFKRNLWLVVGALAGHGVLDVCHHDLVHNTGVPQGWPGFCLAFDVTAAVVVGCILVPRIRHAGPQRGPAHAIRPNHSTDSPAPASSRTAAANASRPVNSVSRLLT